MKKIKFVITETDDGVDVEQFVKADWEVDWMPASENEMDFRDFHQLFHKTMRKLRIKKIKPDKVKDRAE